jgi:Uma2 family endonuclease
LKGISPFSEIRSLLVFTAPMTVWRRFNMAIAGTVTGEQAYRDLALNDYKVKWELWDGVLIEKPPLGLWSGVLASYLGFALANQLDRGEFRLNVNGGRVQYTARTYLVPDVVVIPAKLVLPYLDDPYALGAFPEPLPLVADVWSPPSGAYDIAAKRDIYRKRGDPEIWFLQPFERTLSAWRKQPDGTYAEELYQGGIVSVLSLPGVTIDLDALFVL